MPMHFTFKIEAALHPDGYIIVEQNIEETSSCLPTENDRVNKLMAIAIPTIEQAVRAYVQHLYLLK
jgi:hypothetical protein